MLKNFGTLWEQRTCAFSNYLYAFKGAALAHIVRAHASRNPRHWHIQTTVAGRFVGQRLILHNERPRRWKRLQDNKNNHSHKRVTDFILLHFMLLFLEVNAKLPNLNGHFQSYTKLCIHNSETLLQISKLRILLPDLNTKYPL